MAWEMAPRAAGTTLMPSSPPTTPRPESTRMGSTVSCIWNTASTLPLRSTTAMVAGMPRAPASCTAWAITCSTSAVLRFAASGAGVGVEPVCPPPQEASSNAVSSRLMRRRDKGLYQEIGRHQGARHGVACGLMERMAGDAGGRHLHAGCRACCMALTAFGDLRHQHFGVGLGETRRMAAFATHGGVGTVVERGRVEPMILLYHRRDLPGRCRARWRFANLVAGDAQTVGEHFPG